MEVISGLKLHERKDILGGGGRVCVGGQQEPRPGDRSKPRGARLLWLEPDDEDTICGAWEREEAEPGPRTTWDVPGRSLTSGRRMGGGRVMGVGQAGVRGVKRSGYNLGRLGR